MSSGTLENCANFATINIEGETENNSFYGTHVGGIVGNLTGTVKNSHTVGAINVQDTILNETVGCAIGALQAGSTVENSYFLNTSLSNAVGSGSQTGLNGKTDAELKTKSTFTGWDEQIWIFQDAKYPVLVKVSDVNDEIAQAVQALDETDIIYAVGDNKDNVTQDATAPHTGLNGTTISWAEKADLANNITIINDKIKVRRPSNAEGDKTVSLTATVSKMGGTSLAKDLSIAIKALPKQGGGSLGGSSGGSTSTTPTQDTNVKINGTAKSAEKTETKTVDGKKVTTVTIDTGVLDRLIEKESNKPTVTVPFSSGSAVSESVLTGQMVKNMEKKEAVLEIQTPAATYILPANKIEIDSVSDKLGTAVQLKDIKVNVKVSEAPDSQVKFVENAANQGDFKVIAPPVEFEISCTYNEKNVLVEKFNGFVERMIAIPEGIDSSKITTGVVLAQDGTTYHVPTTVTQIKGKYYAKINSLTNSTYSVVWHPVEFKDVENHWAKKSVNDMGSRMVVNGISSDTFVPNRDITRAEFSAIVVRALGLKPGMGENKFSDVTSDGWYCDYVKTAAGYGIINGYDNGTFGPNDKITREQAMTMIARAMKYTKIYSELNDSESNSLISNFSDSAKTATFAKTSVAACIKNEVVQGKDGGLIAPKDFITRVEVAAIIQRMLQKAELINR